MLSGQRRNVPVLAAIIGIAALICGIAFGVRLLKQDPFVVVASEYYRNGALAWQRRESPEQWIEEAWYPSGQLGEQRTGPLNDDLSEIEKEWDPGGALVSWAITQDGCTAGTMAEPGFHFDDTELQAVFSIRRQECLDREGWGAVKLSPPWFSEEQIRALAARVSKAPR